MTPTHATRNGQKRYRYYLCTAALKFGRHSCPAPSIAAAPLEQVVLQQLKEMSQDCPSVQAVLEEGWPALASAEGKFTIRAGTSTINKVVGTFADAAANQPVGIIGSSGYLEIALNKGNAARTLGVARGAEVTVEVG